MQTPSAFLVDHASALSPEAIPAARPRDASAHTGSMDPPFTVLDLAALVGRARSEFVEMPGLQLTPRQAARLWAVDTATSEHILGVLVRAGFLVSRVGRYSMASAR